MEIIADDKKSVYLYIACYNTEAEKKKAFIAVTKAMLFDEVAIDMENVGDEAILFTSILNINLIKEKLKNNRAHYLLINLSVSYDLEVLYGFLPESGIDMIKKMTDNKFSKDKPHLKKVIKEAVENENFELAASANGLIK